MSSCALDVLDRLPGGAAFGIAFLFLLVRGAHLAWSWNWPLAGDAIGYEYLGWAAANGEPWVNGGPLGGTDWQFGPTGTPTAVRTPGLPLFIGSVYALVGREPNAARLVLVLVNSICAGLLFSVARRHWGRAAATIISFAWVFWPVSVRALYYIDALLGESLAVALLIGALWFLDRWSIFAAIAAGALLCAAILTRPHLALAPVLLAGLWLPMVVQGRLLWPKVVLFFATCAALAVPWLVRNCLAFDALIPLSSQSGLGIWIGWVRGGTGTWNDLPSEYALVEALARLHPELMTAGEVMKSRIYMQAAVEELSLRGWSDVALHGARKALAFLWPTEFVYGFSTAQLVTTVFALLGLARSWKLPAGRFAISVWGALLLSSIVTFYLGRYRFVATPLLLFLSGAGILRVQELLLGRFSRE